MELELVPEQPQAVERCVAELLEEASSPVPDPWWQAGIEAQLDQ